MTIFKVILKEAFDLLEETEAVFFHLNADVDNYYWGNVLKDVSDKNYLNVLYTCTWNIIKAAIDKDLLPMFTGNYSVDYNSGDIKFTYKVVNEDCIKQFDDFHKLTGYKINYEHNN